jgi:hypothetical protein
MISLRDDFEPEPEAVACPPEDVKLWEEVFAVLKPPPDEWEG